MSLQEILDSCFTDMYVPHVLDLIYHYMFDMENANGIPYEIYLEITRDMTKIEFNKSIGVTVHVVDDKLHRLDGPAAVCTNGTFGYYINNKLHRIGGPAMVYFDGIEAYYINDKLHREDGPAISWPTGRREYYINDVLHRDDGPAVIDAYGDVEYRQNGKLHRIGGPAVICKYYTAYYVDGKLHRDDGPAVIISDDHGHNHEQYWHNGEYQIARTILRAIKKGILTKHY